MRIATNINALNSWRNLTVTNGQLAKTLERLSSGYRINRAGDDAAGLAISEYMRGQIAGLNMAGKNAQDGISLIQTAEGALNEVHSMLKRMEELGVQAANDTNTAADRQKLQSEMDQLAREVARIGGTTEFNTLKLLDGTFESKDIVFHIGANEDQNLRIRINDMRSFDLGLAGEVQAAVLGSYSRTGSMDISSGSYTVQAKDVGTGYDLVGAAGTIVASSVDGKTWNSVISTGDDAITFSDAVVSGTIKITATGSGGAEGTTVKSNGGLEAGAYTVKKVGTDYQLLDQNGNIVANSTNATTWISAEDGTTVVYTTSGTAADGGSVTVGGVDISTQAKANAALPTIRAALEKVSTQRSLFGATQNRLEHTINNLQVAAENLQAAESRIRDVDMAAEMANFTKNQILLQAGTAMLAQANAVPQSVLQLLG